MSSDDAPVVYWRRGLHGQIIDTLGQRMIDGVLPPGTQIEPENLVVELNVSRTVVREAIKVLAAKGLLDSRPRRGTYVLPRQRWNLLDADVIRWRNNGGPDARLMVELEEVRQIIEPWGARLAAERRTSDDVAVLAERLAAMEAAEAEADKVTSDIKFHQAVLAAAHNELLEQLEVILEPALSARDRFTLQHIHGDDYSGGVKAHEAVFAGIRDGAADAAFSAMQDLLATAAADTQVSLGHHSTTVPGAAG